MKNQTGSGAIVTVAAPSGGVVSGSPVLIGSKLFGVPQTTAAQGTLFGLMRKGQFDMKAEGSASGQAWAAGDDIYWDNTAKQMTKTSSGNLLVGTATAVKATLATTGNLVLN